MKFLIVSSHPRSGTHFLINSILSSSDKFTFPTVRPSFLSIENLILSHDDEIYNLWINEIKNAKKNKLVLIFKTHCTLNDIKFFIKNEKIYIKEASLVKFIYENALVIYIKRDKIDTLKSWYYFSKTDNILPINSSKSRHKSLTFSNFLRLKNLHKINIHKFYYYEENVVKFIKFHHKNWKPENGKIMTVNYEQLVTDYYTEIKKIIKFLIENKLNFIPKSINYYTFSKTSKYKNSILNKIVSIIKRKIGKENFYYVFNKTDEKLKISKKDKIFISKNYN